MAALSEDYSPSPAMPGSTSAKDGGQARQGGKGCLRSLTRWPIRFLLWSALSGCLRLWLWSALSRRLSLWLCRFCCSSMNNQISKTTKQCTPSKRLRLPRTNITRTTQHYHTTFRLLGTSIFCFSCEQSCHCSIKKKAKLLYMYNIYSVNLPTKVGFLSGMG